MLGKEPPAGLRLERGKLQPAGWIAVDEEIDDAAAEVAVPVEEDDSRRWNRCGIPLLVGRYPSGVGGRRRHRGLPPEGAGWDQGRGAHERRGFLRKS
jgi:hypothetical protein